MRSQALALFAVCAALALCAGCGGGSGAGLDSSGRPLVAGSSTGPPAATLRSIQDLVFTPICTACHVGGAAPQGLRLDAANSYAMLVGVSSVEVPSIRRVEPGRPDDSYIIQKLEGHAAVGERMPFGGPYLSVDTIALIRGWIASGAAP